MKVKYVNVIINDCLKFVNRMYVCCELKALAADRVQLTLSSNPIAAIHQYFAFNVDCIIGSNLCVRITSLIITAIDGLRGSSLTHLPLANNGYSMRY